MKFTQEEGAEKVTAPRFRSPSTGHLTTASPPLSQECFHGLPISFLVYDSSLRVLFSAPGAGLQQVPALIRYRRST